MYNRTGATLNRIKLLDIETVTIIKYSRYVIHIGNYILFILSIAVCFGIWED